MKQPNTTKRTKLFLLLVFLSVIGVSLLTGNRASQAARAIPNPHKEAARPDSTPVTGDETAVSAATQQRQKKVNPKSQGCLTCHTGTESMHPDGDEDLGIGCADCHGGDATATTKDKAHVQPRLKAWFKSSANPKQMHALWNQESDEFVKFVNPGDFRVVEMTCGTAECHPRETAFAKKNMMTHGGMLWGAALYNNGAFPLKNARFGEAYGKNGEILQVLTNPAPTAEEIVKKGILPFLMPLPRWEATQPGNILRVFERGGEKKGLPSDIGSPSLEELAGKPEVKLSDRGLGTRLRVDPVFLGIQKTRLLDPILSHPGTNENPGDFRASGCTACHVVYANDRDPKHSGTYAQFGNRGFTATADPSIPKNEGGHPIKHQMTNGIPSSQCMTCHMHPGTNMVTSYYGMTWWDNETDGNLMYPEKQPKLSEEEKDNIQRRNPEGSALRGKWGQDEAFLRNVSTDVNPKAKRTQFGDFHGHGWVFRNVYKQDRKGNMLTARGTRIKEDDPEKFKKAVHLEDIHQKYGMHCADCHVASDVHGNGNLYGEPRAAISLDCIDCHGTIEKPASLLLSGPAAGAGRYKGKVVAITKDLTKVKARDERGRQIAMFQRASAERPVKKKNEKGEDVTFNNGEIIQNSLVERGKWWRVVQTVDTVTVGKKDYNDASAYAKTVQRDGKTWGENAGEDKLAHANSNMTCYACHSSWTTSCFGCHLPMYANKQKPVLHNEADQKVRNWTQYNFQTLRDDIYMLGKDGTVTGHRVAPTRSTCAVLVGSQNQNREWIYSQQQTVSSEGYSGQAFSTYVPHTVSTSETKVCSDCHVAKSGDNNAWMSQLLMLGTNYTNFIGRYAWVGAGHHGLHAIAVTERDEPQAVIGSSLHKLAWPDEYKKHKEKNHEELKEVYEHHGEVLSIQVRGEYAYVAGGKDGLRVYDISNIDNKGYSERIVTAPVSPIGQRLHVRTKYAAYVASPATIAVDPTRKHRPENEEAEYRDDKQPIHSLYAYLYVADKEEGLILVSAATLLDGNPSNNFMKRALTWNPEGKLKGASFISINGTHAYITTDHGLVIVNINDPLKPRIVGDIPFKHAHSVQIQFRYAFVTDEEGMHVVDVTMPEQAKKIEGASVKIEHAHHLYLARTYAYVAAGKSGLVIVDIEKPEKPKIDQTFTADGKINDAHDVKIGMTNNSLFAYVADGHNGLRVIQLMSPEENANIYGFSPKPTPKLIATHEIHGGEALAVSEGIDRDRAVDESGNQLSVFNRRGARPFNLDEMRRMFLREGKLWTVTDDIPARPRRAPARADASGIMKWLDVTSPVTLPGVLLLMLMIGGVTVARRR